MTLIVARLIHDQINILSDSKKTSASEVFKGLDAVTLLKAIVLHPQLCICFAGSIGRAQLAINSLAIRPDRPFDLEMILEKLLNTHKAAENNPDFMIAALTPGPTLHEIKDGELKRGVVTSWIGNYHAFSDYQRYYHTLPAMNVNHIPPEIRDVLEIKSKMSSAFQRVLKSEIYEDISGFLINVMTNNEGFIYAEGVSITGVRQTIPPNTQATLKFGTAAQGGYADSFMTPRQAGIGAVGLHFFQGHFGALIYPAESEKVVIFPNVNAEQFRKLVHQIYGIDIDGPRIS